jgi:hypothetical protein
MSYNSLLVTSAEPSDLDGYRIAPVIAWKRLIARVQ